MKLPRRPRQRVSPEHRCWDCLGQLDSDVVAHVAVSVALVGTRARSARPGQGDAGVLAVGMCCSAEAGVVVKYCHTPPS
jgi:hypothetical protein